MDQIADIFIAIIPGRLLHPYLNKSITCQYTNGLHLISFISRDKNNFSTMESTCNGTCEPDAVNDVGKLYDITILSFAELVDTESDSGVSVTNIENGLNDSPEVNGNSSSKVTEEEKSPSPRDLQLLTNGHDLPDGDEEVQNSVFSWTDSSVPSTSTCESNLTPEQLQGLSMLDNLIATPPSVADTETNTGAALTSSYTNENDLFPNGTDLELLIDNYLGSGVSTDTDNNSSGDSPVMVNSQCGLSDRNINNVRERLVNEDVAPSCQTNQEGSRTVGLLIRVKVPSQNKTPRPILPGPPVPKTVNIPAKQRLLQRLNPAKKTEAIDKVAILPKEELLRGNEDGDNHLMILVSQPHKNLLELVYALVERMKLIPGGLEATNNYGESTLYIASVSLPEEPLVARYIAETLLDMDIDIAESRYENGQSLAHCVSERGDSHQNVLAELLSIKDPDTGQPIFNLNKPNDGNGHTPLHVAACSHGKGDVCCIATVRLLVHRGANLLEQDWQAGFSVLHIAVREACDPPLVLAILEEARNTTGGPEVAANQVTFNGDTPLHLVAVNDHVCIKKQCEAFRLLIYHGAQRGKRNHRGKVALALVAEARKEVIRKALPRR